jgi:23S rRNA pseudouridine2604 synthase
MERLNVAIAKTGLCSRRQADTYISENRVTVNGLVAVLGTQVNEGDLVELDGKPLGGKAELVILAYHKSKGITCTTDTEIEGNIIQAVNYPIRIFPIGRLDKDSEGLILLTSDGDIVNKILRAENAHEKEYYVKVNLPLMGDFKELMEDGVDIFNPVKNEMTTTLPCRVKVINEQSFYITLSQGLNRQIRRMVATLGYRVVYLKRNRIMHINLGDLPKGQYRPLTQEESSRLYEAIE